MNKILPILMLSLALGACLKKAADDPYSAWMGKWNGPEGTYLDLSRRDDVYAVVIANLDGPITFEGKAAENGIAFEREGKVEIIRAGSGTDTGMKWLADKKDCLVVATGEGFCRD